jgi:hypothetical protein
LSKQNVQAKTNLKQQISKTLSFATLSFFEKPNQMIATSCGWLI